ncbi:MAG: DUF1622 domain-containing protein [Christensenellales bacterium]|jgi:uncharacterized membrane protein
MEQIESIITPALNLLILIIELIGVVIIIIAAVKGFIAYLKTGKSVRLDLANQLALALEFKLAGEILRTVVVRTWQEIGIVASIITLRAILTIMIQWEIKTEEARQLQKEAAHPKH